MVVYDALGSMFKRDTDDAEVRGRHPRLLANPGTIVEKHGRLVMTWSLLGERYHKKGLEIARRSSIEGQDSRTLCPELRTSALQKENGKAFI
jgi:hypothetical protein